MIRAPSRSLADEAPAPLPGGCNGVRREALPWARGVRRNPHTWRALVDLSGRSFRMRRDREDAPYAGIRMSSSRCVLSRLRPLRAHVAFVLLVVSASLIAFGLSTTPSAARDAGPSGTAPAYAGAAACKSCHPKEHALWARSNHARTFETANSENLPAEVVRGARVSHAPGHTTFHEREGRYFAETIGPTGDPHRYALTHVVGRMRVRMFVATLPGGQMQVLPAMREVPTGTWFDYTHLLFGAPGTAWDTPPVVRPGAPSFWTGPVRSWGARCATCHTSGSRPVLPRDDGSGPRATWRALGVDCESCHGPARAHVEAWRDLRADEPLPRLEKLAARDATELCLRCHMEGEVVGELHGDGPFFERLDPTLLLDPERVDAAGRPLELIYEGLSFLTSRCAREGRLTCSTCHAPHGSKFPSALRSAPTNEALCNKCHMEIAEDLSGHTHHAPTGVGARCVSCHMPRLPVERGHGAVTDHSMGVPLPDLESDRVAQDACTWCHRGGLGAPSGVPQLPRDQIRGAFRRWWPDARGPAEWTRAIAAARAGEESALAGLLATLENTTQPGVIRASVVRLLGRYGEDATPAILGALSDADSLVRRSAARALGAKTGEQVDGALKRALSDASPAVRIAAARASMNGWQRVQADSSLLAMLLPVLEEECRLVPNDDERWFRLGAARQLAGDFQGAITAYERHVSLAPSAASVRRHLEELRRRVQRER